jgi:hypothetical protein
MHEGRSLDVGVVQCGPSGTVLLFVSFAVASPRCGMRANDLSPLAPAAGGRALLPPVAK